METAAPWAKPAGVAATTTVPPSSTATTRPQPFIHPLPPSVVPTNLPADPNDPVRRIMTPQDLALWKRSHAYATIVRFILQINKSIQSRAFDPVAVTANLTVTTTTTADVSSSSTSSAASSTTTPPLQTSAIPSVIADIAVFLTELTDLVDQIPPVQQSQRFGNKSYRTWHTRMITDYLSPLLTKLLASATHLSATSSPSLTVVTAELRSYLIDSFGNVQRIDYGTGHELNFILFLLALRQANILSTQHTSSSSSSSSLNQLLFNVMQYIFTRYIRLMQKLQSIYWLEPAGSKGAWGLDDYQFLVFLFGSSQLIDSSYDTNIITNISTNNNNIINNEKDKYLYFHAINFINQMKTGLFHEHSAMLYSISQLTTWSRVNSGLIRMYEEEVMNKFPIVQHIRFGQLLKFEPFVDDGHHDDDEEVNDKPSRPKPKVPLFAANIGGQDDGSAGSK